MTLSVHDGVREVKAGGANVKLGSMTELGAPKLVERTSHWVSITELGTSRQME